MLQDLKQDIAVVFLAYVPYGTKLFERFIDSYIKYSSGVDHDLVILFNGCKSTDELTNYFNLLELKRVKYHFLVSTEQYDIGSYFYAGKKLDYTYLLFMNTYSEILAPNWLSCLYNNIKDEQIGVVGCTGSWGNYAQDWSVFSRKSWNALTYWTFFLCNFNSYLSPHLRTNAFMLRRDILLGLKYFSLKPFLLDYVKYRRKESKLKTLHFEHGKRSMTDQILAMGLEVLIVDKSGKSYALENWNNSFTFWNGEQENLLISDNQTNLYENGDQIVKANMRRRAWNIEAG